MKIRSMVACIVVVAALGCGKSLPTEPAPRTTPAPIPTPRPTIPLPNLLPDIAGAWKGTYSGSVGCDLGSVAASATLVQDHGTITGEVTIAPCAHVGGAFRGTLGLPGQNGINLTGNIAGVAVSGRASGSKISLAVSGGLAGGKLELHR